MIRPQFLFPLFGSLENLKGIGTKTIFNLQKIGIACRQNCPKLKIVLRAAWSA